MAKKKSSIRRLVFTEEASKLVPSFVSKEEGAEYTTSSKEEKPNKYAQILSKIFVDKYKAGMEEVPFNREEIREAAVSLGLTVPRNLGDVVYSYRYRNDMPQLISLTAPEGAAWIIIGTGSAQYAFKLSQTPFVEPNKAMQRIRVPDSTPEIIERYRLSDEQALLSKVRYNRLIDIFLGITTYPMQNHLRTNVAEIGQIEIDEMYVGINKRGQHFIIPVQAKGGKDRIGVVQLAQDISYCKMKFPDLICIPIAVQFTDENVIAIFHLDCEDHNARIVEEKHYELLQSAMIDNEYIRLLNNS